jgi:hypothetical protein
VEPGVISADPDTMDGEFEVEKEILVDVVNGVGPVTVLKT